MIKYIKAQFLGHYLIQKKRKQYNNDKEQVSYHLNKEVDKEEKEWLNNKNKKRTKKEKE